MVGSGAGAWPAVVGGAGRWAPRGSSSSRFWGWGAPGSLFGWWGGGSARSDRSLRGAVGPREGGGAPRGWLRKGPGAELGRGLQGWGLRRQSGEPGAENGPRSWNGPRSSEGGLSPVWSGDEAVRTARVHGEVQGLEKLQQDSPRHCGACGQLKASAAQTWGASCSADTWESCAEQEHKGAFVSSSDASCACASEMLVMVCSRSYDGQLFSML